MSDLHPTKTNVLGQPLIACCLDPVTGYFRDGYCRTDDSDLGRHVVCAKLTQGFLDFTRDQGNDLTTPNPAYNFPGLQAGDHWCLCALRWKEAHDHGVAPPVVLAACDRAVLDVVDLQTLKQYAVD